MESTRTVLFCVFHTVLLSLAVYSQVAAGIGDGWSANQGLLVLFILAPVVSAGLLRIRHDRQSGVLLLPFMAAGAVINVGFFRMVLDQPFSGWTAVYGILLGALVLSEGVGTFMAISILRYHHLSQPATPGNAE